MLTDEIIFTLKDSLKKRYDANNYQRFFHPKMHGFLEAEFIPEKNLPENLKVGIFSHTKTLKAKVRLSNGSRNIRSDKKGDLRGFALKVFIPDGKEQDFILASAPVFPVKNLPMLRDAIVSSCGSLTDKLLFGITHLSSALQALKYNKKCDNLLQIDYWSQTAYAWGDTGKAVKYHVKASRTETQKIFSKGDNFLRTQLQNDLHVKDFYFDFFVQFGTEIENPSVEWKSEFIKVATIKVPRQLFFTKEKISEGNQAVFSPWNCLDEHVPLGELNKAREQIYRAMSEFRKYSEYDISEVAYVPQNALTCFVPVTEGKTEELKKVCDELGDSKNKEIAFSKIQSLHYCRWFVIDALKDADGNYVQPLLAFESNFDGDFEEHLNELFETSEKALDKLYQFCPQYPLNGNIEEKKAFLLRYRVSERLFWAGKQGHTKAIIEKESVLRERVVNFLNELKSKNAYPCESLEIYKLVRKFAESNEDLQFALHPAPKQNFWQKLNYYKQAAVLIAVIIGLLLFPAGRLILLSFLLLLIAWLGIMMLLQSQDNKNYIWKPAPVNANNARHYEDRIFQNQLTIYGTLKKPFFFRYLNLSLWLSIFRFNGKYRSTKGKLSGIETIHFARWVVFEKGKIIMFTSNYDGGWESYLSEFIDSAAVPMNMSFGNILGYPPLKFLFFGGAQDEEVFKQVVRTNQYPCQIWYSAYPFLHIKNVLNNSRVREGLAKNIQNEAEARKWLSLL